MTNRNLAATITIGGTVSSSLGKAFGSVTGKSKALGAELKAIGQQTKELEKMVKELKAAGKATGDLEKKLAALYRRQASVRSASGRLGAVRGMLNEGEGLSFGPIASRLISGLATSQRFGGATTSTLGALNAVAPVAAAAASSIALAVTAVVGFSVAVTALGKSAADFIDGTSDMADGLGVATNNLLGLQYAAGQSGIDADKLNEKLGKLTLSLESAKDGTGPTSDALRELGLTWQELSVMNPEEQVLALAQAFKAYNGNVPKVGLANAFFGKNSARFVNLMNQGREGIKAMMNDSRNMGNVISQEQEEAAAKFDGAWSKASTAFRAVWLEIGSAIIPALTDALEGVSRWFRDPEVKKMTAEFGESLKGVVKVLGSELPIILSLMGKMAWVAVQIMDAFSWIAKWSSKIGESIGGFFYDQSYKPGQTGPTTLGGSNFMPMSPVRFGQSVTGAVSSTPTPSTSSPSIPPSIARPSAGGGNTYQFNINNPTGSPEEVREAVRRALRDVQPHQVGAY